MRKFLILMVACFVLSACFAGGVSFQNAKLDGWYNGWPTQSIGGQLAKPEGKGPFPAVVLLHTCGGLLPHVILDWPHFLKKHGYAVLTVDTFGSRGESRCPVPPEAKGVAFWQDAYGALDYLANRPDIDADRIGVMGFSSGATAIENFAMEGISSPRGRNFKAGIALYGHCTLYVEPPFPILEIIGDLDRNSIRCPVESNEYALATNVPGVSVEIIPGASHAFDMSHLNKSLEVSGGYEASYSWRATKTSRELARKFFAKYLTK